MKNRTIVVRRQTCQWQPNTKRKITISVSSKAKNNAGFISPVFVVLACTAFSALFYIYSVNQTATKGISIRNAEKEIAEQKKENESLKIREAELKSLYHIEEVSTQINMTPTSNIKYLQEIPTVAYVR